MGETKGCTEWAMIRYGTLGKRYSLSLSVKKLYLYTVFYLEILGSIQISKYGM